MITRCSCFALCAFRLAYILALLTAFADSAYPASLSISTYFRDGFTPAAISADPAGNIYVAGVAITDPVSQTASAAVAKFDSAAEGYVYLTFLDLAAKDQLSAITVDSAGNAYVAGTTTNPNFSAFGAGNLGTAPSQTSDTRSFIAKVTPNGAIAFATIVGGSANSSALGIAVTPAGQILVSGSCSSSGFPTTPGAFTVPDSNGALYLTELDSSAQTVIFSATGIGGNSISLDGNGDIYLAGSNSPNYPTTPGAYQTNFVQGYFCYFPCQIDFPGNLQHVTKTDSMASKLIYSTGINDPNGGAGSTTNTGLAIDAAGNAYVTGTLLRGAYPFTVPAPDTYSGYISKLDPAGANLLFSLPVGGAGVKVDSSGGLYVGGTISSYQPVAPSEVNPVAPPDILSWIPQECWPDNIVANDESYVLKIDSVTGSVLDGQWIDGSAPVATGIALSGGKVWLTGFTPGADVPFTRGVVAPGNLTPVFVSGGYLSAVDFSASSGTAPQIACVLDGGNFTHVGPVSEFQLISIFGRNLGPVNGVAAPDGTAPSIAGVSVTFDGNPAQLLYVSASQINLAVPALPAILFTPLPTSTLMQIEVNGESLQRQFPFTESNLNLFADLSFNPGPCVTSTQIDEFFQPFALNADGTRNSCSNPAKYGSTVSFFMHGAGSGQLGAGATPLPQLLSVEAIVNFCSEGTTAELYGDLVYKVDVILPSGGTPCAIGYGENAQNEFRVTFTYNGAAVGPRVAPSSVPIINFEPGQPMPMIVWVTE